MREENVIRLVQRQTA